MLHSMTASGSDGAPLAADVIVRRRGAPDAEHQQICWNNKSPVIANLNGLPRHDGRRLKQCNGALGDVHFRELSKRGIAVHEDCVRTPGS